MIDLPIMFVVEDNGISTTTPTGEAWGRKGVKGIDLFCLKSALLWNFKEYRYQYKKVKYPHQGIGKWIQF